MTGWKLVLCYIDKKWALALAKLEIPEDAIIISPTNSKKRRCDKATVKAIYDIRGIYGHIEYVAELRTKLKLVIKGNVDELRELDCDGYSIHEMDYFVTCVLSRRPSLARTIYRKGETVSEQDIDVNPDTSCAQGIHFFNDWTEAIEWGFTSPLIGRASAYAFSVERLLNKLRLPPPVSLPPPPGLVRKSCTNMEAFNKSYFIFRRFTIMTKEEFFKKAKELKDKAAEKTRPAREKVKTKIGNACTWVCDHKGTIAGAAVGALFIHTRGYLKGWSDGRVQEHTILERRYDTTLKLALKKEGMTEEEVDTFNEIQELAEDFGGLDEVRCLLNDDFEGWCKLRDSKEEEEDD